MRDFARTFVTFFRKPDIVPALLFMLFYRLPEAMCLKLVQPFFVSPREEGGLALSTSEVGFVNGTVGVVALLAGGILGGIAISRGGLKKWLWPMALSYTSLRVLLRSGYVAAGEFLAHMAAIFTEQFGYGFGFTAFMLYLIYFSGVKAKHPTMHSALHSWHWG